MRASSLLVAALLVVVLCWTPTSAAAEVSDSLSSSSNQHAFLRRRLQEATINNADLPDQIRKHEGYKKVLVTGAAGFVGSHVSDLLLHRGDDVIVLDEVNDYYDVNVKESNLKLLQEIALNQSKGDVEVAAKRLKIYRGDVCNATLVEHIFQNDKPEWVVHMAARAGVRPSIIDPFVYIHSNIQGTANLFDLAIKYKVINFVYASSSSVYGGSKSTFFDEHENVDFPISSYAASKRVNELQGMYYNTRFGIPGTALRFFTVYGPRGRPDMAPFKFIDWTARGKAIQQFGNGSSSRDYTYIEDIVSGVVGSLDRPYHKSYRPLNLGKGSGTVLSEFVQIVAKYVGKEPKIDLLPDQPGDVPYTCANVTRAHNWVNYTAGTMFELGISKTVDWYKKAYPYEIPEKKDDAEAKAADEAVAEAKRERRRRLQAIEPHTDPKSVLVVAQQESTMLTETVVNKLLARGDSVTVLVPTSHESVDNDGSRPEQYTYLKEEDYMFTVADDQKDKLTVKSGNVDDFKFLEGVMGSSKPNWICYLNRVTNATASGDDPHSFYHINLQSFVRLLEVSRKNHKDEVSNIVVLSSTDVYEPQLKDEPHVESETIETFHSHYAISQKARELYGHTWHSLYKFPVTALRMPEVFGPDCECSVEGSEVQYKHNDEEMKEVKEFIFVDDAADGIVKALDRAFPYQIFNLPGAKADDKDACQSRSSIKNMVMGLLAGSTNPSADPVSCARGTVDKSRDFLDYEPQVTLKSAVEKIAEWYRKKPELLPPSIREKLKPAAEESAEPKEEPDAPTETKDAEEDKDTQEPEPEPEQDKSGEESSGEEDSDDLETTLKNMSNGTIDVSALWPSVTSIPAWIRELAQIQWLLICALLIWRVATVRSKPVRNGSNSSLGSRS